GERLLAGATPLHDTVALVSGRASFELVQKAAVAGIPVLCAVSAPSSLAVETARRLGVTLVGFLRGRRVHRYAPPPPGGPRAPRPRAEGPGRATRPPSRCARPAGTRALARARTLPGSPPGRRPGAR